MALVIANVCEGRILDFMTKTEDLYLRLYSNNVVPAETDTAATFTQVVGGGYAAKLLAIAGWTTSVGSPSFASFAQQLFAFTGPTTGVATIYGYYVVNAAGLLYWAERFPGANVPFTPVSGSVIRITPRLECS